MRFNLKTMAFALSLLLGVGQSGFGHCCARKTGGEGKKMERMKAGTWGGDHIGLEVKGDGGATVTFDCAHGTISQPIMPDRAGNFAVEGTYVRERGGPVREDEENGGQPATYAGHTDGKTMTLTITLAGKKGTVGKFSLAHGRYPRIRKCL